MTPISISYIGCMKMNKQNLLISKELMEELRKAFGEISLNDLIKNEFDRGVLYGQEKVIRKLETWKKGGE